MNTLGSIITVFPSESGFSPQKFWEGMPGESDSVQLGRCLAGSVYWSHPLRGCVSSPTPNLTHLHSPWPRFCGMDHIGASGTISEYLGPCLSILDHIGASQNISEHLAGLHNWRLVLISKFSQNVILKTRMLCFLRHSRQKCRKSRFLEQNSCF